MNCLACGEKGHKSSQCKAIGIPPDGQFVGGGGGGGGCSDEEEETIVSETLYSPNDLMDDEIQSILKMQKELFQKFPNKPSNAVVQEA